MASCQALAKHQRRGFIHSPSFLNRLFTSLKWKSSEHSAVMNLGGHVRMLPNSLVVRQYFRGSFSKGLLKTFHAR
jgi:hypothetical protein